MKGYNKIINVLLPISSDDDSSEIEVPAKMLGSSIADGRYNGVSDGSAGLLVGQYDNDESMSVDPLCDFATDITQLRPNSSAPDVPDVPSE